MILKILPNVQVGQNGYAHFDQMTLRPDPRKHKQLCGANGPCGQYHFLVGPYKIPCAALDQFDAVRDFRLRVDGYASGVTVDGHVQILPQPSWS